LLFGEGPANKHGQPDPSFLRAISTKDIEAELKSRKKMLNAYLVKAQRAREDALSDRRDESHESFKNRLKESEQRILPQDAPSWLKKDLQNLL